MEKIAKPFSEARITLIPKSDRYFKKIVGYGCETQQNINKTNSAMYRKDNMSWPIRIMMTGILEWINISK